MTNFLRWLCLTAGLLAAGAVAANTPEEVVKETTEQVRARVRADLETLRADSSKLYGLVNEVIIPHFDFVASSRLVLGKYWRTATDAQRARFVEAFKQLLVRTYANSLLQYVDEDIEYKPSQTEGELVVVKTEVSQHDGTPVPVYYRMHQVNGEWKAVDVWVDGISLVVTYRGDFGSRAGSAGLDTLIADLEAKNRGLNK
jgi:phospholipid transport system substrate-binding protein